EWPREREIPNVTRRVQELLLRAAAEREPHDAAAERDEDTRRTDRERRPAAGDRKRLQPVLPCQVVAHELRGIAEQEVRDAVVLGGGRRWTSRHARREQDERDADPEPDAPESLHCRRRYYGTRSAAKRSGPGRRRGRPVSRGPSGIPDQPGRRS